MYLLRLIKSTARLAQEGSAAHTRFGGGNLRSAREGCRQSKVKVGGSQGRVLSTGLLFPWEITEGDTYEKGDAPLLD